MHVRKAPGTAPAAAPRLAPRKDIQGLRAVAVALVVLAHAGVPFLPGGFIGVDVFFVVSGFLITQILLREASATGSVSLVRFYARRARRILPASTLVLLVTSIVAAVTLSASRAQEVVEDVLWSSVFAANIHFGQLDTDYFSLDRAVSPVQHYWSLAVEEQFYLVLPLLVLVVMALGRRRTTAGRRRNAGPVLVGVLVGVLSAVSLAWSVLATPASPTTAYFSSFTRGWELGAGVLLALAVPRLVGLGRRTRDVLAAAGLSAILAAAVLFDAATAFPGYAALLPVLGTMAVLAAGVGGVGVGVARPLTWRPVTWVGDLSYSIYLWHWPALVLGAPLLAGDDPEWLEKTVLVGAVVALSTVSYHLVEQPFRSGRVPGARGRVALVLWPVSVGAVVLSTSWVTHYQHRLLEERTEAAERYYDSLESPTGVSPSASVPDLVKDAVQLAGHAAPIHFPLDNLDGLHEDHWAVDYPCSADFRATTAPSCELGDPDAEITVAALGDSHMGMWLPALDVIGQADGFRVVPFVKWACPSIDVPTTTSRGAGTCEAFRDWTLGQVRELEPDVILLSNRVLPPNMDVQESETVDVWEDGLRSTLATMAEITPELRVFDDIPRVEVHPGDCLTQDDSTMATCTPQASPRSVTGIVSTRRVANQLGVPVVNVAPLTCFEKRCPLVVDQTVVYRDYDHISLTWGRRVIDELRKLVDLTDVAAREPVG